MNFRNAAEWGGASDPIPPCFCMARAIADVIGVGAWELGRHVTISESKRARMAGSNSAIFDLGEHVASSPLSRAREIAN